MSLRNVSVDDDESLARTVHFKGQIRTSDNTLRPELFLPFRHVELSVVRHRDLSGDELLEICQTVAEMRQLPLYGRGDIQAADARGQNLDVHPYEEEGTPRNHANIINWPNEKTGSDDRGN